jgi:putative FmdB family regulatory protein
MPRYAYKCDECEFLFERVHSMTERLTDCEHCEQKDSLKRLPSTFRLVNKPTSTNSIKNTTRVGEVVRDHIEEAKKEVEEQKEKMTREYEV